MNIDKVTISDKKKDGRVKLLDIHKQSIRNMYAGGMSTKGIILALKEAYDIKVSYNTIYYILNPDKLQEMRAKTNWKDHYNKDAHQQRMKKHRNKKREILLTENKKP